jgi:hypothetical protein
MAKIRLVATREFEVDPANYVDVEWPVGTDARVLTDPAEIAAYEQHLFDDGVNGIDDVLDHEDTVVRYEVVEEPQTNPFDQQPTVDNPFTPEDESRNSSAENAAKAEAEATGTTYEHVDRSGEDAADLGRHSRTDYL